MDTQATHIATDAIEHWSHVAPALMRPSNEAEYERMIAVLDAVLDKGGAEESAPLATLASLIGDLVAEYEEQHHAIPVTGPVPVLRFLMEQEGLRQSDLPEIGAQSVVSDVLSGKRELNLRQVSELCRRFGISSDAFIG